MHHLAIVPSLVPCTITTNCKLHCVFHMKQKVITTLKLCKKTAEATWNPEWTLNNFLVQKVKPDANALNFPNRQYQKSRKHSDVDSFITKARVPLRCKFTNKCKWLVSHSISNEYQTQVCVNKRKWCSAYMRVKNSWVLFKLKNTNLWVLTFTCVGNSFR